MDITVTLPDLPGMSPVESNTVAQPTPAAAPQPSPAVNFLDPVRFNEGTDPATVVMNGEEALLARSAAREHLDRLEAEYGFLQATKDAFSLDTTVGLMMQDKGRPDWAPDPAFSEDHFKDRVKKSLSEGNIAPEYADRFASAVSDAHYDWIEQNIREDMTKQQKLAELGWKGVGARLLAGALDPGAIAIGLASGGLGAAAAKAAQVGRIGAAAISAASGAAGNVAVEAVLDAEGKPSTAADYLMAGALGAALGGAAGVLSTSPREAAAMAKVLREHADYVRAVASDIAPPARDIAPDPMRPFKPTEPFRPDSIVVRDRIDPEWNTALGTLDLGDEYVSKHVTHGGSRQFRGFMTSDNVVEELPNGMVVRKESGSYYVTPKDPGDFGAYEVLATLKTNTGADKANRVNHIVVSEDLRRQGIATKLVDIARREDPNLKLDTSADGEFSTDGANFFNRYRFDRTYGPGDFVPLLHGEAVGMDASLGAPDALGMRVRKHQPAFSVGGKVFTSDSHITAMDEALKEFPVAAALKANTEPEKVFGYLLPKSEAATPSSPASLSAAARPGGIDTPFLTKENLEVLTDENVSKTAGMARYSLAGDLGKSKNPLTRALGMPMVNDAVGREGHAVNAFPADLEMSRLYEKRTAEFQRTRHGAYETWKERTKPGSDGLLQFDKAVLRFIRTGEAVDPEVETAANAFRASMKEQLLDAQNPGRHEGKTLRPVPGSENVPIDDSYAWRLVDAAKVNRMVDTYGEAEVRRLVREAIFDAQPHIDADVLEKLSEGYVRGLRRRAAGIEDDFAHAFTSGNQQRLAEILRMDTGWSDQEIEAVLGSVFPGGKSRTTNLKERVLLTEGYKTKAVNRATGVADEISFLDLLSDDLNFIHTSYTRRMSGQVALQRVRVANPEFGKVPDAPEFLIDGIADPSEFKRLLAHVQEMGADSGQSADEIAKDIFNLQFAHDRLRGVPLEAEMGKFAENLRRLRGFNFMRIMSNTAWSMIQEPATLVSQLGIKSTFSHFPALRRAITGKMEKSLLDDLGRELEAMAGIGTDGLRGLEAYRYDEMVGMWETKAGSSAGSRMDTMLAKGQRFVANLGMHQMTMMTQRLAAKAIVQKIANFATREPSAWEYRRMAQLGLDESMTKRIFSEMENHATFEDGLFFSHNVKRINTEKWTDLEALAAFERTIYRYTHKLVQNNDLGSMATWMSHPLAKTLLQFRTYNLVAWDNQLQYNLHMRDPAAISYFAANVAFGALIYAVQTQLASIGRSDRDEYLEKRLSWDSLAGAGFSRASFSSIIPAIIDTGALFAGVQPFFDFRSSGQPQNIVFGNPTTGFIFDDAPKAIRGLFNATIGEDEATQQDFRNISRSLPLGNWLPAQNLLSIMSQGVPEKPYNRH